MAETTVAAISALVLVVIATPLWRSLITELADPSLARRRVSRAATAFRPTVGAGRPPRMQTPGEDPPGRHRSPSTSGRGMPPAGTWSVTVPAGGPDTRHRGGPICL